MVKTLKLKKADGQRAINFLREKGWLDTEYRLGKTQLYLILPLTKSASIVIIKKELGGKIEEKIFAKIKKTGGNLKEKLADIIPKKYLKKFTAATTS